VGKVALVILQQGRNGFTFWILDCKIKIIRFTDRDQFKTKKNLYYLAREKKHLWGSLPSRTEVYNVTGVKQVMKITEGK
jgi:hypothetical protein